MWNTGADKTADVHAHEAGEHGRGTGPVDENGPGTRAKARQVLVARIA